MTTKTKKITLLAISAIMSLALLVGCSKKATTMTDRAGNEFAVPEKVEKIISTAPSNTEILTALGLGDKLVAIDKYSSDIEGINKDIAQIDFRNPDAEAIVELQPDVVIASGHNAEGSEDPFAAVKEAGITVVYLPSAESIDGIYKDIEFISEVTGTESEGKKVVDELKSEIDDIKKVGETITDKKKVYFEIGSTPTLYSFGKNTFLNEIIEIIGAENVFADQESWISPSEESVISANPDVIITNETYIDKATEVIATRPGWDTINAVKNKEIFLVDNNTSSRGSQNIIKAIKDIAKAVYPDKYAE